MNEDLLKGLYDQLAASDNVSGDFQSFVAKTQKDNGKGLYEFMQELEPSDVKYEDFAASLSAAKKKDGTTPSSVSSGSQESAPIAAIGTELKKEVVNSWDQAAYTGEKSLIKKLSSLPAQPAFEPEGWQDVAAKVSTPAPYTATGRDYSKDPFDAAEGSRKGFETEYDVRKAYQEGTGIQKANRAKENLNMRWEGLTMDAARANKSLEDKFGEDWQQRLEVLGEEASRASQITEKDIAEYKKTRTKDEFEAWKASNEAVIDQYNAIVGSQEIKDLQGVNAAQKKVIEARKTLPEKFPELKLMEKRQQEADDRIRMMITDSPAAIATGAMGELVSQTHRFLSRVGTGALSAVGNLPDAVGNFEGDIPVPKVMGNLFRGISDFADRQKLTEEMQNPVPSPLTRQLMESVVGFEGKNVVVKNGAVKAIRDDNGFIVKVDPKFEDRFVADGGLEKAQNVAKSYTGTGNAASMFGNMAADMAVMLGASVAGGNPALIASSYALIQQDLAMEGKNDLGMTQAEAAQYAGASAGLQSLIESFISPAKVLEGGNVAIDALQEAFKLGRREVAAMAGKAPLASLPYIFAAPAAKLALQMAGENSEEITQNLADQEIRSAFNRNTASNLKVEEWDRSDYVDTIAMTTLLTGGLGLSGMGGSAQRYQQNALVKAVEKPELYNALVDDLAQKGGISFDEAQAQKALIAQLGKDASFFPADMSAEDKRKAMTLQSLSIQAGMAAKQEGIPEFEQAARREAKKKYDEGVKEVLSKYSPEREVVEGAAVTGEVAGVKKTVDLATKLKEKMFPKAEVVETVVAEQPPAMAQESPAVEAAEPVQEPVEVEAAEAAPKEEGSVDPFAHLDTGIERLIPAEMMAGTNEVVFTETEADLASPERTVFSVAERLKADKDSAMDAIVNVGLNLAQSSGVKISETELPGFAEFLANRFDEGSVGQAGSLAASDYLSRSVRDWALSRDAQEAEKLPLRARFQPETFMDRVASFFERGGRITPTTFGQHGDANTVRGEKAAQLNYFSNNGKALDLLIHDGTLGELDNGMDEQEAIQQVVDFINSNTKGPHTYIRDRVTEQEAEKYAAIRGEVYSEEEFAALGRMENDEVAALQEAASVTSEWTPAENAAIEDYLKNFLNEDGNVDHDAVLESINGFDPNFLNLPENVQQQLAQLANDGSGRIESQGTTETEESGEGSESVERGEAREADVRGENETPTVNADLVVEMNNAGLLSDEEAQDVIDYLSGDKTKEEAFDLANSRVGELVDAVEDVTPIVEEAKKNDPTGTGMVAPVIIERDGGSMVIGADIQRDVLIGMGGKWNKQMQGYFVPGKNKVQVLAALATDRVEEREVSDRATGLTKIFSRLGAARQARRLAKLLDSVEGLEAKVALLAKDKAGRALLASQEKLVRAISLLQKAFPNVEIVIDPERFRAELIKRGATPAQIERAGGFVSDGKVFLNANELSAETPVHEFGHIWNNWTKKNDRAKFDEGISQMIGSEYEAAVRADPMYSGLSDEDILEEALAMAIGEKGARFLDMTAFERFKEWLAEMWGAVASKLGVRAENMTVRDMADGIARRMLSGNEMLFDTKARIAELEEEKVKFNFMGSKAKMNESVRADLLMAKEIENDFPADRVWAMTGWYRGVDGQWRRENPATDMAFKTKIEDGQSGLLGDFVEGSIFDLYPELARLPFRVGGDVSGEAHLDTKDGVPVELAISKGANIGVVAHEIQHFIQIKEGFAKGSPATDIEMTRQIVDQLEHYYESGVLLEADENQGFAIGAQLFEALADPNQAYYASAGEVEARLVQKRMALKDERGWGVFPSQPVGIYDNHFVSDRGLTGLREFPTYDEAMAARKEGEVVAKLADRQSVMPLLMSDVAPEEQLVFGLGLRNQVVDSFAKTIEERNLDIPSEIQFHFLSGAIQATQAELSARAIIASEVKAKRITPTEDAVKKISDAFGFTDLQVREMWGEEVAREKSIANRFFVAAATFEESAGLAKDAMKKLDRWIKKYFYNNGLLPSGIYGRALQKNSAVEARLRIVRGALADLEKAAKKEAGNYKEDVRGLLDAYMKGEGLLPAEWVDTKIAAIKLRNMIDAMSVDLVREAGMKGKINVTILENAGIDMSFMPKDFGVEDLAMAILDAYADPETLNDLEPEQLALFKFFEKNTDPAYLQELKDGLANGDIVDLEKFDAAVAAAMEKMELAAAQTARVLKILNKNPYDRTKVETYILNKYLTEKKVAAGSYLYRSYAMNDDPNYVKSLMKTPEGRKAFADARMHLIEKWQGEIDELEAIRAEKEKDLVAHLARVDAEIQKSLDKAKEKLEAAKPYTKRYADIKKVLDDSIFYALTPINEFLKKEDMSEVALAELAASVRNIIDLRLQKKSLEDKIAKRGNWKENEIERLQKAINDVDGRLSAMLTKDKPVKATENSMLGAAEEAMLKEREDIDEIMRAAMGEYLDVRVNVAKSAYKLAHFIESQRLLNEMRDKFAYIHFFPDGQQKGNATHQLPQTGFGAMSGWWTTKDIYDEMKEWNATATRSVVENGLARFISALKYGKTIWSPVTHARNFVGNVAVAAANGNYNHLDFGKSLDLVREIWHRPDAREYFQYLTEIGVIQGSAAFSDIGEALNGISKGGLKAGMEKADQALGGWLFEKPEKFYAVEDDFWRVYSFHAEMNAYSKALYGEKFKWDDTAKLLENKNFKELAPRISEIIQNTMPTYARTARYVNVFRYLPIGGSFIHFPAEIWRTSKNIVELSLREMSDPRLRGIGTRRLLSFGATMTALSVLVEYLSSFVIDDDKNDWLEYFVKPWQKYGTKLFTKAEPPVYDENHKLVSGGYEFTNLSFTNPYSQMIKPFNVMLTDSDKGMGEKSMDAFMEAGLESFLNDGLFFGPVFDVMKNQKDGRPGKEVWGRDEDLSENALDAALYLAKNFQPGIWKLTGDIAKSNELDKVFDEKFSKETADKLIAVSDALGFINNSGYPAKTGGQIAKSFLGLQAETVDPYISGKQMFGAETIMNIRTADSDVSKAIYSFNNKKEGMNEREIVRSLEGIRAEYLKDNASYQQHLAHAAVLVDALEGLGLPEAEMNDILTKTRWNKEQLKKEEINALRTGEMIPLEVKGLEKIRSAYFEATGKDF